LLAPRLQDQIEANEVRNHLEGKMIQISSILIALPDCICYLRKSVMYWAKYFILDQERGMPFYRAPRKCDRGRGTYVLLNVAGNQRLFIGDGFAYDPDDSVH